VIKPAGECRVGIKRSGGSGPFFMYPTKSATRSSNSTTELSSFPLQGGRKTRSPALAGYMRIPAPTTMVVRTASAPGYIAITLIYRFGETASKIFSDRGLRRMPGVLKGNWRVWSFFVAATKPCAGQTMRWTNHALEDLLRYEQDSEPHVFRN
jgi:hypothetical protein